MIVSDYLRGTNTFPAAEARMKGARLPNTGVPRLPSYMLVADRSRVPLRLLCAHVSRSLGAGLVHNVVSGSKEEDSFPSAEALCVESDSRCNPPLFKEWYVVSLFSLFALN
mgnify:CR=1 FL=1